MTWFSLICLLAVSSSAFGRSLSSYGSYAAPAMRDITPVTGYSSFETSQRDITPMTTGYGAQSYARKLPVFQNDQSTYGKSIIAPRVFPSQEQLLFDQQQLLKQKIQEAEITTEADKICRGQRPESIIPLDGGRRFIVCVDDGKGFEQVCPKDLLFHPDTRRCERKLGAFDNLCASQPCLNGGQCVQQEAHQYQCQCAAGYDGRHCELDATVCQTQQPCGQGADVKCQSFRWGAALTHVCIFQGGRAYGLNSQQTYANPCSGIDGPQPLAFSNGGFLMCDGSSMYLESCPGGTGWDDSNKACVWPDMKDVFPTTLGEQTSKYTGYNSYATVSRPVQLEQPRMSSYTQAPIKSFDMGYGQQEEQPKAYAAKIITPQFEQTSYGHMLPQREQTGYAKVLPVQREQTGYAKVLPVQREQTGYAKVLPQREQTGYGETISVQREQPTYGETLPPQQEQSSYSAPMIKSLPRQMDIRPIQSSGY